MPVTPPGLRVLGALVGFMAVVTLWSVSVPATYFMVLMTLPMIWLVLAVIWLFQAVRMAWVAGLGITVRNPWLVGIAAVVFLTVAAWAVDGPLLLRFELSRPGFEALVAEMMVAGAPDTEPDRSIGLFDAERIERIQGGVRFLVKGTGFLDPGGFAYSPGREPEVIGEDRYYRFSGPWWIWVESW